MLRPISLQPTIGILLLFRLLSKVLHCSCWLEQAAMRRCQGARAPPTVGWRRTLESRPADKETRGGVTRQNAWTRSGVTCAVELQCARTLAGTARASPRSVRLWSDATCPLRRRHHHQSHRHRPFRTGCGRLCRQSIVHQGLPPPLRGLFHSACATRAIRRQFWRLHLRATLAFCSLVARANLNQHVERQCKSQN